MLKAELEKNYNDLRKNYIELKETSERRIKSLNSENEELHKIAQEVTDRERNLLINLVAIQHAKKVKRNGPNGEKYEEIIVPDLDYKGWRPARENHNQGLGRLI